MGEIDLSDPVNRQAANELLLEAAAEGDWEAVDMIQAALSPDVPDLEGAEPPATVSR